MWLFQMHRKQTFAFAVTWKPLDTSASDAIILVNMLYNMLVIQMAFIHGYSSSSSKKYETLHIMQPFIANEFGSWNTIQNIDYANSKNSLDIMQFFTKNGKSTTWNLKYQLDHTMYMKRFFLGCIWITEHNIHKTHARCLKSD